MPVARFRRRRRLRRREVAALRATIMEELGAAPFSPEEDVDLAEGPEYDVLFAGGKAVALLVDGKPLPTVRGLLRAIPPKRYVTVDMGAVPYIYNGADVMAPGIVDSDPAIRAGDMVWVRDEKNGRPLAVGRALISGEEMRTSRRGKAVETIHHVGDALWKMDED